MQNQDSNVSVDANGQLQLGTNDSAGTGNAVQDGSRAALDKVDVSVGADGQIRMQQQTAATGANPTGLILVEVQLLQNGLQVEIADFRREQVAQYRATLPDGNPLPSWIQVDPVTGKIIAQPPGQQVLELHLIAQDRDGTLRTLVVRIDPSPQNTQTSDASTSEVIQARTAFMQQIASHQQQWAGYGAQLLSVFHE